MKDKLLNIIEKAKQGNANAQYIIGSHYYFDKNDFLTGLYWLRQAEKQLHENACLMLYAIYNEGCHVKHDKKKAKHYLLKSRLQFYKTEYNKAFGNISKLTLLNDKNS